MTGLARTDLATSRKVHLAAHAVSTQGQYGSVSKLAGLYGVSRPTVLAAREQADRVLTGHFDTTAPATVAVKVDRREIERMVIALRVCGQNSVRAIEGLLSVLLPGVRLSYGFVQSVLAQAEQRAAAHNALVDLTAIKAAAVDEMFSQGEPVLAGVDLDSGFLFALEHRSSRASTDWAEVLRGAQRQGLQLRTVVKDAAHGIAAGVSEVFPHAEQRDDCFHAHHAMSKTLRVLESRAYAAIATEIDLERQIARLGVGKKEATSALRSLRARLAVVKQRCAEKIDLHDAFLRATECAREAMEVVDLQTGTLRTAAEMKAGVLAAATTMLALDDRHAHKVGTYMRNRASGLAAYADDMRRQLDSLAAQEGSDVVALAAMALRLMGLLRSSSPRRRSQDNQQHMLAVWHQLQRHPRGNEVLAKVEAIHSRRHRASSAIEGFNAALRPHLYVHKTVTQGFLELFRAHFNLRQRRSCRHKGSSAYSLVTGQPVADWLAVLGYPPSADLN